jgi:hypothetical protein
MYYQGWSCKWLLGDNLMVTVFGDLQKWHFSRKPMLQYFLAQMANNSSRNHHFFNSCFVENISVIIALVPGVNVKIHYFFDLCHFS